MNVCYEDLLSRIVDPPEWWDENAVPRWCPFSPERIANLYARQVCLLLIRCQNCHTPFNVAMSWHPLHPGPMEPLSEFAPDGLFWGDPPNVDCCFSGPTQMSETLRVLEFWQRDPKTREWVRVPRFEGVARDESRVVAE